MKDVSLIVRKAPWVWNSVNPQQITNMVRDVTLDNITNKNPIQAAKFMILDGVEQWIEKQQRS